MKPKSRLQYENQSPMAEYASGARITSFGFWHIPSRAINAMCPDGKRRTITLQREADTFYSIPGHVSYDGTTVTGVIYSDSEEELIFAPHTPRQVAIKMYHAGGKLSPWDNETN